MAKVMMHWAELGFNFRLDAIPFIGKPAYKATDEADKNTYDIIAALNTIARYINPECVLLVESYESMKIVKRYFGTTNQPQAQLSYNFHLSTFLWLSLILEDGHYIWEKLEEMVDIPIHAEWINFLRNHDELSLAYLDDKLKDKIWKTLEKRGEPFREGHGISGTTYSLLGHDLKKFMMAYFLLASVPGGVGMLYVDEIAGRNIPLDQLPKDLQNDTRNINRGKIAEDDIRKGRKAGEVQQFLKRLFEERHTLLQYINVKPKKINGLSDRKGIFACQYKRGSSKMIVVINLTGKKQTIEIKADDLQIVFGVNGFDYKEGKLTLNEYSGVWLNV